MSFTEYAGRYVGCNPQSVGQEAERHIAVLEKRIAELEDRDALLRGAVAWFEANRPSWGPGTLPTWYVDATQKR